MDAVATPRASVKRRSIRRWGYRALAALPVLLALGYAGLPWLIPTRWLADAIAANLSQLMNRPVVIGDVQIGWGDGMSIERVRIGGRPGVDEPDLAHIDAIRLPFTPLRTLVTGKVDKLLFERPHIWLSTEPGDELGPEPWEDSGLESIPTWRYTVRDASLTIVSSTGQRDLTLGSFECEIDRARGLVRAFGHATAGESRVFVDVQVAVPRLKRGLKLSGGGEIRWSQIAIEELPWLSDGSLPIGRIAGLTDGRLQIEAHPDLGIDFDLDLRGNELRLRRDDGGQGDALPATALSCGGHWDPAADILRIDDLDYRTKIAHVRGRGRGARPALVLDQYGRVPLQADLAVTVADWPSLRRLVPELDVLLRDAAVEVSGPCELGVSVTYRLDQPEVELALGGYGARIKVGDAVSLPSGVEKRLRLLATYDARKRRYTLRDLELRLGDLAVTLTGSVEPPTDAEPGDAWSRLLQALSRSRFDLLVDSDRLEEVAQLFPVLGELLQADDWSGKLRAGAWFEPAGEARRLSWRVNALPGSQVRLGDYLFVPPGDALLSRGEITMDSSQPRRWRDIDVSLRCGSGQVRINPEGAALSYALSEAPTDGVAGTRAPAFDASLRLPIEFSDVERLVRCSPVLSDWLTRTVGRPDAFRRNLDVLLEGAASVHPGDWSYQTTVTLSGTDLEVSVPDWLERRAGDPLNVAASYRAEGLGEAREHELSVRATLAGAGLSARMLVGRPAGAAGNGAGTRAEQGVRRPYEELTLQLQVGDAERLLRQLPWLSQLLKPYHPSGAAKIEIYARRDRRGRAIRLALDASDTGFVIPDADPLVKKRGIPCRVGLVLESPAERGDQPIGSRTWRVRDFNVQLASCRLNTTNGEVVTTPAFERMIESTQAGLAWRRRATHAMLERVTLDAQLAVEFDSSLRSLSPALGRAIRRYAMVGQATAELHIDSDAERLRATGRLDTRDLHVRVPRTLGGDRHLIKPLGLPASIEMDVGVPWSWAGDPQSERVRLDVHGIEVALAENRVRLSGTSDWHLAGLTPRPGGFDLRVEGKLPRLDRLAKLLPESAWETLRGGGEFDVALASDGGPVSFGPSWVAFDEARVLWLDQPLRVDGHVEFSADRVLLDELGIGWGSSSAILAGEIVDVRTQPNGSIAIACNKIDLDEIDTLVRSIRSRVGHETEGPIDTLSFIQRHADLISRCRIEGHVGVRTLLGRWPGVDIPVHVDELRTDLVLSGGTLDVPVRCAIDGGLVEGRFTLHATDPKPRFDLNYEATRIKNEGLVQSYLTRTFPGLRAAGPLTLIDESHQLLDPGPDESPYPLGSGELIVEGGTIRGRAAPKFVARMFPRLKLARFRFVRMHDWFTKHPDGSIEHDIVYQGDTYHMFSKGRTTADGRIKYDVGIDLLSGKLDSKYWADTGQGRIPLFTKAGRIGSSGGLIDERVSFLPPWRVADSLLVKNSPVITAYYAIRKQMLATRKK